MTRLEEIRAREKAATRGPWLEGPTPNSEDGWATCTAVAAVPGGQRIYAVPKGGSFPFSDKQFIAHAREDIPYLLDLVERAIPRMSGVLCAEDVWQWLRDVREEEGT